MLNLHEDFWFALHLRSGAEMGAAARLTELEIETFLPLVARGVRHARRTCQMVKRPLFPGYFFARFCPALKLRAVNGSHGVIRVLGNSGAPLPVDVRVIDSIRERIGDDGCVALVDRGLAAGDAVRVTEGPLWGWSGVFERELSDAARVIILIETLQQPCRVVVRREALAPVGAN
jgi:transcriptional antiterminator RfaH